jgi:hypothetical protein
MKDFLGIALLGVGAYVLYEYFASQQAAATQYTVSAGATTPPTQAVHATNPTTVQGGYPTMTAGSPPPSNVSGSSTTSTNVAASPATDPTQMVPVTDPATLAAVLKATAQADGYSGNSFYPDEWSYFYQNTPGKPTISPAVFAQLLTNIGLAGQGHGVQITAEQFVQGLFSVGLSGIRGLGRVYISGMGGLGVLGYGRYGVNSQQWSDASAYELVPKYLM